MDQNKYQLIVLNPGHFHAALVQKSMNKLIDTTVKVYAPEGQEIEAYLHLIDQYNKRPDHPTTWHEEVYIGDDYLDKMLQEERGNKKGIVILAGNNERKTEYIKKAVDAGLNVFSDKPMAINPIGFRQLKTSFEKAQEKGVFLYDIMTERYVITNILQKAFSELPEVFGTLERGTIDNPAVVFQSVHHFYKQVSGKPLIRPDWYFDVKQQGEGIVDVTTHYIDLIEWECFPQTVFDDKKEVEMLSAKHWPTVLTPSQFEKITDEYTYPDFLKPYLEDSLLQVNANGEMDFTLKGIHAKVMAEWKFQAPEGGGDTFQSLLRGTKANLMIKQGKAEGFIPTLYIVPLDSNHKSWETKLENGLKQIQKKYPDLSLEKTPEGWKVLISQKYKTGHEQHFSLVLKQYLQYIQQKRMPEWEKSFMLTKYFITTSALKYADIE